MASALLMAVAESESQRSSNSSGWNGPLYSGVCWRLHSMSALPLPGVGLANTLFGLLATVTFCIILHIVYTSQRRARSTRLPHEAEGDARSRAQSGSGGFLASFASLSAFSPGGSDDSDGSAVSFSSYVKFLRWSSLWALLWIAINLFPQITSGRGSASLVWHAIVSSVVYTASVFLELAVVVFLLNKGVGQQAFRSAAIATAAVSIPYGSLNLYFRLGWDIALARDDESYPIAQLDFISTRETMMFLWISSVIIAAFFLAVSVVVQRRTSATATSSARGARAARAVPRRKSDAGIFRGGDRAGLLAGTGGKGSATDDSALPLTASLAASSASWAQEAASPLIAPRPSAGAGGLKSPVLDQQDLDTEQQQQPAPTRSASFSPSVAAAVAANGEAGETAGKDGLAVSDAAHTYGYGSGSGYGDSRSPSPSATAVATATVSGTSGAGSLRTYPPQRRSVVLYSLFLALYYTLKAIGLALLYFRQDAGICLIDGAILLYMIVYAFLLYWTLVQDSAYWHGVMSSVRVLQEERRKEDESRLLTGPASSASASASASAAGASASAAAGRGSEGKGKGGPAVRRKLLEGGGGSSGPPSRSASRDDASLAAAGAAAYSSAAAAAAAGAEGRDRVNSLSAFTSPRGSGRPGGGAGASAGSSGGHLRSASVLLRDYIIPASQLSLLRVLEVPESASAATAGRGGRDSKRAAGGVRGRGSPMDSPALSRSGSGSGIGMTKWTLAGAVSSRLRVVAAAGGWSDRSCTLWLARWKGAHSVGVKQFTLPSITADFFTRDFQSFLNQVPMGNWVGSSALAHENIALCLGVSVDPPCVSLVFEYGAMGLLYDILYPKAAATTGPAAAAAAAAAASVGGGGEVAASPAYQPLGSAGGFDSLPTSPGNTRLVRAPSIGASPSPPLQPTTPGSVSVGILSAPSTPAGQGHSRSLSFGSSGGGGGAGGLSGGLVPGPHLITLLCPYRLSLQIASAMAQLQRWSGYDAHPLHLSPAAVMLDEALNVKLANLTADFGDFAGGVGTGAGGGAGAAGYRHGDRSGRSRKRAAAHLSQPAWQSPEVLAGAPPTRASAVFSFATLLWCVLTWQYPCVLVPREERPEEFAAAAAGGRPIVRGSRMRAPSPSRSHSHSASSSASVSVSNSYAGSYRAVGMGVAVPSILKSTRAPVSVAVSPPSAVMTAVRPATQQQQANERAGLLSSPLLPPGAGNSASSAMGELIRSAPYSAGGPPSPDLSPPSSPRATSDPLDGDADRDADLDEQDPDVGGCAAPAVVLDVVRLRDLKTAQRFVMIENRRPPLPRGLPAPVARLIELCWDENPEDRPSFDIIVDHLEQQCGELAHLQLPLSMPMPTHTQQGDAVHLYFQQMSPTEIASSWA